MTRLLTALVLVAGLAAPASSVAATTNVEVSNSQLLIRESGDVAQSPVPTQLSLTLPTASGDLRVTAGTSEAIVAGAGCAQTSQTVVTCSTAGFQRIDINTGTGADSVDLSGVNNDKLAATVDGGPGADIIRGGPSDDVLSGGTADTGNDLLVGGPGGDTLTGGPGNDGLSGFLPSAMGDTGERNVLIGNAGLDIFEVGSSLGADEVRAGEDGEVGFSSIHPYAGALAVDVPASQDIVTYERRSFAATGTAGVTVDMDSVADDGEPGEADFIGTEVEHLYGSARADRLTGNAEVNRLVGLNGRDKLFALAGDDLLDLRDGIEDECPSAGTGANSISADLVDEATFDECTVNEVPPSKKSTSTTTFIAFDDPTTPAAVGRRLKGASGKLLVALRCPPSPQTRCAGSVLIEPVGRASDLGRKRYSLRKGASTTLAIRVGRKALRRLRRDGGAEIILTEEGPSPKGPKRVICARTF